MRQIDVLNAGMSAMMIIDSSRLIIVQAISPIGFEFEASTVINATGTSAHKIIVASNVSLIIITIITSSIILMIIHHY